MLVPIPGSDGSYNYDPSIPAPSGGGGGGGGGDFSTAKVTFINSAVGKQYNVLLVEVVDTPIAGLVGENIPIGAEETIEIPLYKGAAYINIQSQFANIDFSVMPSWTGGISLSEDQNYIKVTSDGTFTAAGSAAVN